MLLYSTLGAWGAFAVWGSISGLFARYDAAFLMSAGFAVPWAGFALLFGLSDRFRKFVFSRNPKIMSLLQAGRILGGAGFAFASVTHLMPLGFTIPTFVTDEIAGLSSFWAAYRLRDRPKWFAAWQVIGFLFMVAAGTLGILASPAIGVIGPETSQPMTRLPFSMVPAFFAPMVQIAHLIVLAQLWSARERR